MKEQEIQISRNMLHAAQQSDRMQIKKLSVLTDNRYKKKYKLVITCLKQQSYSYDVYL